MPRELTCFVIIPSNWLGKPVRLAPDDRWGFVAVPSGMDPPSGAESLDFDQVYQAIIQVAVNNVNNGSPDTRLHCIRGEDIAESGDIRKQVIEQICEADITITDITSNNPNVFLEYGIRLSVKDSGNLLICHERAADRLPFNIGHLRAITYSNSLAGAHVARNQIEQFLFSYLKGHAGPERSLYYEFVELFTGRLLEKKLTQVARDSPALVSRLATAILATGDGSKLYREPVFDYLMKYKEALATNPRDQEQVIEHLKLIACIEELGRGRIRQTYYELAKICNADPSRKEEGMRYLESAKELED